MIHTGGGSGQQSIHEDKKCPDSQVNSNRKLVQRIHKGPLALDLIFQRLCGDSQNQGKSRKAWQNCQVRAAEFNVLA